jgi:hypothetical protein
MSRGCAPCLTGSTEPDPRRLDRHLVNEPTTPLPRPPRPGGHKFAQLVPLAGRTDRVYWQSPLALRRPQVGLRPCGPRRCHRLRALPGRLPLHGENAWLRGAYRMGRGDDMTSAGVACAASGTGLSRKARQLSARPLPTRSWWPNPGDGGTQIDSRRSSSSARHIYRRQRTAPLPRRPTGRGLGRGAQWG